MTVAVYEICCDWDLDGDFTDTYDDISADVKTIHFSRGKSDELSKAEVGQLSITVNNDTGKYTPGAGGVISALLLPKRPIRVRATYNGTTYNRYYGYIEEIIPHPHLAEQDCIITATDGLDYLARADLATELIKNHLTGSIHTAILYNSSWPSPITTNGLVLNAPLFMPTLDGATFNSDDSYKHLCTVIGAIWGAQGRTFDGIDDNISIPNHTSLIFGTGDFTVLAWVSLVASPAGDYGKIIAKGQLTAGGWHFGRNGPTNGQMQFYNPDGTGLTSTGDSDLRGAGWKMAGFVRNGANGSMWLNGVADGGVISSITANLTSTASLLISNATASSCWDGSIGEILIYNRALSPIEIQQIYNSTKWKYQGLIDNGQDTVPYWYGADVKARFAQEEIDKSEQGFSYVDGAGYYRFEDRYHRSTATHQTSQGTFDNTMSNISYSLNPKNVYNIAKVTVTPWELKAEAELWRLQETPSIPIGETYTYWGESQYFIDAWTTLNSGATDYTISGTFTIAQTNFAKSIKIVITNTGTTPNVITLLRARGTYYDDQTKVTRKAEDTTSQTAYQKRTFELDGKYMTDTDHAQDLSNYAIRKYKDPRAEISLNIMNQDAATLTQILSREISDRITIKNTKLGITSQDFFIDYMEHDISISGLSHTATYHLADCINEDFWCLDYSKLAEFATSGQTKLGY